MATDEMVRFFQQEALYWRGVAMWMADVHAANAQDAATTKRTSKGERKRQARIAQACADLLREKELPRQGAMRTIESIATRCDDAARDCTALPAGEIHDGK